MALRNRCGGGGGARGAAAVAAAHTKKTAVGIGAGRQRRCVEAARGGGVWERRLWRRRCAGLKFSVQRKRAWSQLAT
jgi:hypothetical protein